MSVRITLPLPDKRLHPNGGKAHNVFYLNKLKKGASEHAWAVMLGRLNRKQLRCKAVRLHYDFYLSHPGNTARADKDNLRGWMKAYQDGIAEAIGIDDRHFEDGQITKACDPSDPRVEITIEPLTGKDSG